MTRELLYTTQSVCPECLKLITAQYVEEKGIVYFDKHCPEHGEFRVLAWRDAALFKDWQKQTIHAKKVNGKQVQKGCPYDCGLCAEHEGATCTAVMEITYRCNLACKVCFADTEKSRFDPDLDAVSKMYNTIIKNGGHCSVQLSGGEPTVRDDLPRIIEMGKKMGFSHIQINTNGIRIAEDISYLEKLKEAGSDLIYLQFDGVTDDVYKIIRGKKLLDVKLRAIENCTKVDIGVLLVPTIIPNVNYDQISDIISFAKQYMPTVKGIHFQPVSYFGRYPGDTPKDEDRVSISDVMHQMEIQTKGEIKLYNMVARKRYDAHCAFSSLFYLDEAGTLRAITQEDRKEGKLPSDSTDFAEKANKYTNEHWRKSVESGEDKVSSLSVFTDRLRNYTLSITGMGFQDVWNLDIMRLKGCCVHVVTADGNMVPLCAFHVTSTKGERLYRNEQDSL